MLKKAVEREIIERLPCAVKVVRVSKRLPTFYDFGDFEGLTTAAGIWMTAAVGVATGLGRIGVAALGAVLTLLILAFVGFLDSRIAKRRAAANSGDTAPMRTSLRCRARALLHRGTRGGVCPCLGMAIASQVARVTTTLELIHSTEKTQGGTRERTCDARPTDNA